MGILSTGYIQQVPGLGTERKLNPEEIEHVIVLLRVVEQLPILSECKLLGPGGEPTYDSLIRCLESIHSTHVDLAKMVEKVLKYNV